MATQAHLNVAGEILSVGDMESTKQLLAMQDGIHDQLLDFNRSLRSLNEHADENFSHASARFAQHTATVTALTADLTRAYERIRALKSLLAAHFPDEYRTASQQVSRREGADMIDEPPPTPAETPVDGSRAPSQA